MTAKKIENETLYTKNGCNLIFTVKGGVDVSDLVEIHESEIKEFIKSRGLSWANKRKVFLLNNDNAGKYTDDIFTAEVA